MSASLTPIELIDGTESKKSFAIIHRTATHKIGIRPLLDESPSGTYIGFRLRVVPRSPHDANQEGFVSVIPSSHANGQAYPAFPWDKCDTVRASLMGGIVTNIHAGNTEKLKKFFADNSIARSILTALKGMLNTTDLEHEAEVSEWLWTQYHKLLDNVAGGHHYSDAASGQYQMDPVDITISWSIQQAEQEYHSQLQKKFQAAGLPAIGADSIEAPQDPKLLN